MRRTVLLAALLSFAILPLVGAQSRYYYFNGIGYVFPSSQGGAATVLTNDGSGNLTWSTPPTPEGLWSGSVVLSTSACPAGWTRLAAADNRILRGAASAGGTGGSDTHTHTLSGSTDGATVTVTGTTAASTVTITGSTASASISHTHGTNQPTAAVDTGGSTVVTNVTIESADANHSHGAGTLAGASHSHGAGTLAGASHTHGAGTLAAANGSTLPAWYGVILCAKD